MKNIKISHEEILKSNEDNSRGRTIPPQLCDHCGKAKQSVEALFWVYGTSDEFRLQLPVCACDAETESASKPETQTTQPAIDTQSAANWRELYRSAVFENDKKKLLS